jgi:P-type Cu+ transporter
MEKDPVCGMDVEPKNAAGKSEYKGKIYYFCSLGCKKEFEKNPEKFLDISSTED